MGCSSENLRCFKTLILGAPCNSLGITGLFILRPGEGSFGAPLPALSADAPLHFPCSELSSPLLSCSHHEFNALNKLYLAFYVVGTKSLLLS